MMNKFCKRLTTKVLTATMLFSVALSALIMGSPLVANAAPVDHIPTIKLEHALTDPDLGTNPIVGATYEVWKVGELNDAGTEYNPVTESKLGEIHVNGVKDANETAIDEFESDDMREALVELRPVKRAAGFLKFEEEGKTITVAFPLNENDEAITIQPKITPISKDIVIKKVDSEDSAVDGAKFAIERVADADGDLKDNIAAIESQGLGIGNSTPVSANGEISIQGLREGVYTIKETEAAAEYNLVKTVGKFEVKAADSAASMDDVTVEWLEAGKFKTAENVAVSGAVNATDKLVNYLTPNNHGDVNGEDGISKVDGSYAKEIFSINGTEIPGGNAGNREVRVGDKLVWNVYLNVPDNIAEYKAYGFIDTISQGLVFDADEFDVTYSGDDVSIKDKFTSTNDGKGHLTVMTKSAEIANLNPDGVLVFKIYTTIDAKALNGIRNSVAIVYNDGNGNGANIEDPDGDGVFDETDVTPVVPEGENEIPTEDNYTTPDDQNPKMSDKDNQFVITPIKPGPDGKPDPDGTEVEPGIDYEIYDETGEDKIEVQPDDNGGVKGLPDGNYIVKPVINDPTKRPPRPIKITITDGEITHINDKPVVGFDENGVKFEEGVGDADDEIHTFVADSGTWVPSTGTLTVLPLLGIAATAGIAGIVFKRKEDKE